MTRRTMRPAASSAMPPSRSTPASAATTPDPAASRAPENVIAPRTGSSAPSPAPAQTFQRDASRASARAARLPEEIRARFVIKRNVWRFSDGEPAFVDRGDSLITRGEHPEVIATLAAIAQARRWREVTISGSDAFQRQMRLAARRAGLDASEEAPASPQKRPPRSTARARTRTRSTATAAPREWRGQLIEHGVAPSRRPSARARSYVVKLQTPQGVITLWGADLKRALEAALSHPQPGDEVVLRRVDAGDGTPARDDAPEAQAAQTFHAEPRYHIETREFLDERERLARRVRDDSISPQRAAREHPQLAGVYLQLRLAQLVAQRLSHAQDQRRFVRLVREAMADAIARGEPIRILALRARSEARRPAPLRE